MFEPKVERIDVIESSFHYGKQRPEYFFMGQKSELQIWSLYISSFSRNSPFFNLFLMMYAMFQMVKE